MHDARAAVDRDELGRHDAPGQMLLPADAQRTLLVALRLVVVIERRLIRSPTRSAPMRDDSAESARPSFPSIVSRSAVARMIFSPVSSSLATQ